MNVLLKFLWLYCLLVVRVAKCVKAILSELHLVEKEKDVFSSRENISMYVSVCEHISRCNSWKKPLGEIPLHPVCVSTRSHLLTLQSLPTVILVIYQPPQCLALFLLLPCPHSARPLSNHPSTPLRSDPKSNDDNGFTPKWPNLLPLQDLVL